MPKPSQFSTNHYFKYHFFQNVSIIFFSAAKDAKERKISEVSSSDEATKSISINDDIDSDTESARSDIDADSENEDYDVKEALMSTNIDVEWFQKQILDLDEALCVTDRRFDKIQAALNTMVENLRIGKPLETIETVLANHEIEQSVEIKTETEIPIHDSTNVEKIENSHEIYDRERLLEVLRNQTIENKKNPPRISVGMIGYPNVGKSSSVNVLMQTKKVILFCTRHLPCILVLRYGVHTSNIT